MSFPVSDLIGRLRSKMDVLIDQKNIISQDGTSYTVSLSNKPIASGTDEIYINHATFTTGFNQYVYRNLTQPLAYASGVNLVYTMNYSRGELNFFQGSGYVVGSGLSPFAPWSTSTIIAYYRYSKYTDALLADYLSYAVAGVEGSLQIGMYVSGLTTGPAPQLRSQTDIVDNLSSTPYAVQEKIVVTDTVEVIQELIARKAMVDMLSRERRIGVGNAIKVVDGDTSIDTSVNQRYFTDLFRDSKQEYTDLLKFVMMNMVEGYTIKQVNESAATIFGSSYFRGGYPLPYIDGAS